MGAGASKQAGAPLMADFLDCAYDLVRLKTPGIIESGNDFNLVFDAISELRGIHYKAHLDLDNIEIVFGAIEMGLLLKKLGSKNEGEIKTLRDALITLIYKTLESSVAFPVRDKRIFLPKPYDSFMGILTEVVKEQPRQDPHEFSFITFNYDLCLDVFLQHFYSNYSYCLELEENPKKIPLLKLHGSINWGLSEDEKIIPYPVGNANFNLHFDPETVIYNLGTILPSMQHAGKPLTGPPVIVPPTWNKNSYHGQLSNVWSRAANELAKAENIFIIGYSLPETDSFFRYLYALGSEGTKRLRNFIVINKDTSGTTEDRFRSLIGKGVENRFKYLPLTFSDGLGKIKSILMNP